MSSSVGKDGKICLVTGATSGIGYVTALELSRMGASVVLVGRNLAKCQSAVNQIRTQTGNPAVDYLLVDLSSQAQIRAASDRFLSQHDHLDVLVNNAGGFFMRRSVSVDGIEMTFALNHLAYFLLTHLLIDALKNSPSARVINVSSGSHLSEHLDFNDLQLAKMYNPMRAYGRSKLANILFSYELARRLGGTHVTSNALTPGMVATEMWKKVNRWLTPLINPVIQRIGQTPEQGAQTSVYLASSPEVEGVTGKYFADKHEVRSNPASYDLEAARKLWEISATLVGISSNLI